MQIKSKSVIDLILICLFEGNFMEETSSVGTNAENQSGDQKPYLSPLAICAMSVGSAIGWGSLVVTCNTYLAQAGVLGSVLGLLIGFVMMLMVARHYHFLANRYSSTGGLYTYIKSIYGYDRAFLAAWFLFLVYIAIFWANATSIPLFARYFFNNVFRIGFLYTIFGYDVYLGEALLTLIAMLLVALISIQSKKLAARSMVGLTFVFTVGITICFTVAMLRHGGTDFSMAPAFIPNKGAFEQVMRIAFISPWAFIGFESVTNSPSGFSFKRSIMFRVLVIATVVTTALYIFVILLSVSAYPAGCASWLDYIQNLDKYEGIEGLPAFYAANYYMGNTGVLILMASLLSLVLTSLIGMLRAVSRLCYAMALDGIILSGRYAKLNKKQVPVNAILLVLLVSLPIPFIGRTAIGWIVDTTTIGATIIYGFVTVAVFKIARREKCRIERITSAICLGIMVVFMAVLLLPGAFSDHTIETESYVLLAGWSVLGLLFFSQVVHKDYARNFGRAIIVWLILLAFIVTMAMTLASRVNEARENAVIDDISDYMTQAEAGVELSVGKEAFLEVQRARLLRADHISVWIILGLFGLSFAVLLVNYRLMRRWEKITAAERDHARSIAFTDPLTGVKSKQAFALQEKTMEEQVASGEHTEFGVIVCDVNGLKKINDTLGHKAGDEYIRTSCELLCVHYKYSPVYRIGGDEFVVLLQGRDYDARDELLAEINAEIEQNIGLGKAVLSLGQAIYDPAADSSFYDVFKRADGRMYERKMQLKSMGAATRD